MILNQYRKKQLSELAQNTISIYCPGHELPDLNMIANKENINLIFDHYERCFEGMTICSDGQFFIHIDLDSTNEQAIGRRRFTLAHELAHTLIDEHRIGLLTKQLEPHASDYLLGNNDKQIELEADYFASVLLMPEDSFIKKSKEYSKPFSAETIKSLAIYFNTSLLAALIRFTEIGTESILSLYCKNGKINWFTRSNDFPQWPFKFKVHSSPPENTVLGDYCRNKDMKFTEVEDVDIDSWFYPKWDTELNLKEQCIYVDDYDYVISILWFSKT